MFKYSCFFLTQGTSAKLFKVVLEPGTFHETNKGLPIRYWIGSPLFVKYHLYCSKLFIFYCTNLF